MEICVQKENIFVLNFFKIPSRPKHAMLQVQNKRERKHIFIYLKKKSDCFCKFVLDFSLNYLTWFV